MAEGHNSVWVIDRELDRKFKVAYWSEHVAADLLRRLRAPEVCDLYELCHEELGAISGDSLLIDLGLPKDAVLSVRERPRANTTGDLIRLHVGLVYTAPDGKEYSDVLRTTARPNISLANLVREALRQQPRPCGAEDKFYVERKGVLQANDATLAELAPIHDDDLTIRNRLRFRARFAGAEIRVTGHPSMTVGKILQDFHDGRHGSSFQGRQLDLRYAGRILPREQTLGLAGVHNDAVVEIEAAGKAAAGSTVREPVREQAAPPIEAAAADLAARQANLPERIEFRLQDAIGGKERPVKVPGRTTVAEVIKLMADKHQRPAANLVLLADGVELDTAAALGRAIAPGALVLLQERALGLSFSLPGGRSATIAPAGDENVGALLARLAAQCGLAGDPGVFVRGQRIPASMRAAELVGYQPLGLEVRSQ